MRSTHFIVCIFVILNEENDGTLQMAIQINLDLISDHQVYKVIGFYNKQVFQSSNTNKYAFSTVKRTFIRK